jgi:hypothetical protein
MATSRLLRASRICLLLSVGIALLAPAGASARHPSAWGPAQLEVGINSAQADGCPIETPDGKKLYFASTRPGAVGGPTDPNDIWVVSRKRIDAPWGEPRHLPEPVNSAAADFCPTPLSGNRLYFVSSRTVPGACGAGDMYRTRKWHGTWRTPKHLGCVATGTGPNFAGGEFSPSIVRTRHGTFLYFSSTGLDGLDQDIYVSRMRSNGSFGPPRLVEELSTSANDQMPNVSPDGREIVFASDRPGTLGAMDIYTARRDRSTGRWSTPVNVGSDVNTAAAETRPSLSGDGKRLHFGRLGDIWVSTRHHGR